MCDAKALLFAIGITVVSMVALTITMGLPTREQLAGTAVPMFAIAFVVMKFGGTFVRK